MNQICSHLSNQRIVQQWSCRKHENKSPALSSPDPSQVFPMLITLYPSLLISLPHHPCVCHLFHAVLVSSELYNYLHYISCIALHKHYNSKAGGTGQDYWASSATNLRGNPSQRLDRIDGQPGLSGSVSDLQIQPLPLRSMSRHVPAVSIMSNFIFTSQLLQRLFDWFESSCEIGGADMVDESETSRFISVLACVTPRCCLIVVCGCYEQETKKGESHR